MARVRAGETTLQELERVLGDVGGITEEAKADSSAPSSDPRQPSAPAVVAGAEEELEVGMELQAHVETLEPEAEGKPERYIYVLRRN